MNPDPPSPSANAASIPPVPPPRVPDHELIRRIGRGAYGEVWLARSVTGAFRAVKIVHRQSFDHDRPFEREFEGIQKFEPVSRGHASQVDILHIGRGDDCFYYVMELADDQATGGQINPDSYAPRTLKSDLQFHSRLPFEECVRIGIALATALENLHGNGLVHRDVKPSNIIFVNGVPKLADIGLVTGVDATRSYVGTEGFAAPEGPGTAQADLYSLGKVLYEAATGKDRQEFPDLPTQLRELPDREGLMELNTVLARACRHDPKDRYASATAMRADLELLRSGKSLARLHRIERRLRSVQRAAAVVTVLALLLGAAWLYQVGQTRRAEARVKIGYALDLADHRKEDQAEKLLAEVPLSLVEHDIQYANLRRLLGHWRAIRGQWKEAAVHLAILNHWNESHERDDKGVTEDFLYYGPSLVELGDYTGYERFRKAAITRYLSTTNSIYAHRVCKISLLVPASEELSHSVASLYEVAKAGQDDPSVTPYFKAWGRMSLAVVDFRRGHCEQAVEWCERCLASPDQDPARTATIHIILALAYQQLNRDSEARSELTVGGGAIKAAFQRGEALANDTSWNEVWDWVYARILLREAEKLLGSDPTDSGKPK